MSELTKTPSSDVTSKACQRSVPRGYLLFVKTLKVSRFGRLVFQSRLKLSKSKFLFRLQVIVLDSLRRQQSPHQVFAIQHVRVNLAILFEEIKFEARLPYVLQIPIQIGYVYSNWSAKFVFTRL